MVHQGETGAEAGPRFVRNCRDVRYGIDTMNRAGACLSGLVLLLACASPREGLQAGDAGQTGGSNGNQGGGPQTSGTVAGGANMGGTAAAETADSGVPVIIDDTAFLEAQRIRREAVLQALPIPFGEWRFDDAAGATVTDSSGNRNTGSVMKGTQYPAVIHPAPTWQPGYRGTALQLNGLDEWVMIPTSNSVDRPLINGEISISAWVFVRQLPSPARVVALFQRHQLATRLEQYFLGISPAGTLRVGINFFYSDAEKSLPVGRWTHVAMTHNGLKQCGYVDGRAVTCHDVGNPPIADQTPITMGAGINENDVTENLNGAIDEVRFYDVNLNDEQVAALAYR
jgi:hypothetical protein